MSAPKLKSRAFREGREAEWLRLERLLERLRRGSPNALSDDDLIALPALYRSTLSSLSIARAVSLDRALVDYLESLCTRAYFAVYGVRTRPLEQVVRFFAHDWPAEVRRLWRETLAAAALTALGVLAGFLLVRGDPDWFGAFVDARLAAGRGPEAGAGALRASLYGGGRSPLAILATFLFTHNAQVAIYAFALGFLFCVPTAVLVVANGATLGAFFAVYDGQGLAPQFGGWVLIHGTTELFAIVLAAAAGFRLGAILAWPGDRTRGDALAQEGRRAVKVLAGVLVMLTAAALLEGFARQLVTNDAARYAVAATAAVLWGAYFYGPALRRRRIPR